MVDIYNGILLSHKTMPFAATWIYLEIVILSEVRQSKINTRYCLYVESKKKKNGTKELVFETEIESKK